MAQYLLHHQDGRSYVLKIQTNDYHGHHTVTKDSASVIQMNTTDVTSVTSQQQEVSESPIPSYFFHQNIMKQSHFLHQKKL